MHIHLNYPVIETIPGGPVNLPINNALSSCLTKMFSIAFLPFWTSIYVSALVSREHKKKAIVVNQERSGYIHEEMEQYNEVLHLAKWELSDDRFHLDHQVFRHEFEKLCVS